MSKSTSSAESLQRLSALFAARRARLLHDLSNEPSRIETKRPIAKLQDYGYSVATGLALTAALPVVLRILFKQRKLLFKLLMVIVRIRKVRRAIPPRRSLGRPR